ncbi:hypothetical protein GKZ68_06605 [Hymenobacter sp. BRD128]|uniref:hypothetical protein n=1 Tax=Hymenobacter sp. BRD128 TaxID=2675878 RepID=UPI001564192D|nr:hypothetical protein [Hymenobacter sp. BRD128]QKG56336.1 hypothetical protein GKZ68_06605 [Hymenobacter sp. BRD128]
MKRIKSVSLLSGLLLFGCNQTGTKPVLVTEKRDAGAKSDTNSATTKATLATAKKAAKPADDKEQIQTLIRKVLKWGDSLQVGLLPGVVDTKKKAITSLNLSTHRLDLAKLRTSGLFAAEFIENYNKVILTIDKRLRNGTQRWLDGDQPDFGFSRDVNAWCGCQDVPYDKPNPYDFVEVNVLSKGPNTVEATWHWGKLPVDADPGWKDFSYKFRAVKENGEWRITYLEGFDFTEALKPT